MKKITLLAAFALCLTWAANAQQAGEKVHVLSNGAWNAGTVKEEKDGKWLIQYENGATQEEWVEADRLKIDWKVGDKVNVEWKGDWYEAVIMEQSEGKYKVHYDGWGDEWDEWVISTRMKR